MKKMENLMEMAKLNELLGKKENQKKCNVLFKVLAIVGIVAAVAAIAYAIYRYFTPDYLEDFEKDFEEDFAAAEAEESFFEDEGAN